MARNDGKGIGSGHVDLRTQPPNSWRKVFGLLFLFLFYFEKFYLF